MGSMLLAANHFSPTTPRKLLRASTPYHTRIINRRQQFVLGDRPKTLQHLETIDQRSWRQYRTHLDRVPAWERAATYVRQIEARRLRSHAALEKLLGVCRGHVDRAVRLLQLPEPVLSHLKAHPTPSNVRYFTEHRLLELLKHGEDRAIWREFQRLLGEAAREAGIWAERPGSPDA